MAATATTVELDTLLLARDLAPATVWLGQQMELGAAIFLMIPLRLHPQRARADSET